MLGKGTNKRSCSEDVTDEEQPAKRHKTTSVRFIDGQEEEEDGTAAIGAGKEKIEIYVEEDVQRIRKLRKDKAALKAVRDYLDTEEAQPAEIPYTSEVSGEQFEPFSMDSDLKYGRFDENGAFIFKRRPRKPNRDYDIESVDSDDDDDDPWLVSLREEEKKRKEAEAAVTDMASPVNQKRGAAQQSIQEESSSHSSEDKVTDRGAKEMLYELCSILESSAETPVQALIRLKEKAIIVEEDKAYKALPQSREQEDSGIDREASLIRSRLQRRKQMTLKKKMSESDQKLFDRITKLTDELMLGGKSIHQHVLSMPRDALLQLANSQAGQEEIPEGEGMLWQFRWRNSSDQAVYGPYNSTVLFNWIEAGYITDSTPVDLREVTPAGEPIDGVWRDWKTVRLEGTEFNTEEEVAQKDERKALRREELERKARKEAEFEESDDEEL